MPSMGKNAIRYRIVVTKLKGIRNDAIKVQGSASKGHADVWVPRSLLHTLDDRAIETTPIGTTVNVRIVVWKAEELGFA